MSTTTVFVEILIIGLEAVVWLGMALGIHWDTGPIMDWYKRNQSYSALLTPLLLALVYVAGIIVDRAADSLYKPLRYNYRQSPPASVREMRLQIMHASSGMTKFLEYQRSRLRIARATIFNLLMFLLVAVIWLARVAHADPVLLSSVIAGCTAALIMTVYAARRIDEAQMKNLVQAYEIITEGKEKMNMAQRIAAAVCYRHAENGIEFLLVRTKGGKHWTFPKGHINVKQAEAPWQAARREAGEEAGVDGVIDRDPLSHYAYFKGKETGEEMVAAFLMRVTSEREPDEPDRTPQWFPPTEAIQKLSEGRGKKKYIAEHRRVIDAALARLAEAL